MIKPFFEVDKTNNGNINLCENCGLYKDCYNPKMKYTGKGKKKLLILSNYPDSEEDRANKQIIGPNGQLLRDYLEYYDIDLDEDCWIMNAVACKPKSKKPSKKQIKCCKEFMVDSTIEELKPEFIWLLGEVPIQSMYMGRFSKLDVLRWRNLCIPDKKTGAWIIPLFHPEYILSNDNNKMLLSTYDRDIKFAVSCLRKKPPIFENFESMVHNLIVFKDVIKALKNTLNNKSEFAFDYETTNLKPFGKEQKIWSLSICDNKNYVYSFPISYHHWKEEELKEIINLWVKILQNRKIKKIAHNLKFEDMWTRVIFDIDEIKGWYWCSMNAAHILDDRAGFSGLKLQSYVNFGIEGYEKESAKYIKPKEGEKVNRLDEMPLNKLLLYNGLDSLLTYRLYKKQYKQINNKRNTGLKKAWNLTLKGLIALSDAQIRGIGIDSKFYDKTRKKIIDMIEEIDKNIHSSKEVKMFFESEKREINMKSTKDLKKLFFDIMKLEPTKVTTTGMPSVDKEALESMNNKFVKDLLTTRKLDKIIKYIDLIVRESDDGKIHPFFDLHTARSFRSSSNSPNFQNFPSREEPAKSSIRKGIIALLGCLIGCCDYGSMEVRIIGCYTKDLTLMNYIKDPTTDMHRDQAGEIFKLVGNEVTKELRFFTKNQFVFPEFYGSWYKACARNLWTMCKDLEVSKGVTTLNHLKKVGIIKSKNDYKGFENHVQNCETKFWERFPGVKEWQEKTVQDYIKNGYVTMKFGHKRSGYLTKNMIINSPIQGAAFHCLLWSLIKLNNIAKRKYKSSIIGQIHDEIVWNIYPEEKDEVLSKTKYIMTEKIREEHDWIIVPLEMEPEITEVNQSWYYKKEIKI